VKELSPSLRRFAWQLGLAFAVFAMLPSLANLLGTPTGTTSLGVQTAVDDHLVYAAWMKQAMEGRFFFENRFTLDAQPGLTVNLYFWTLGNFARVLGIPVTMLFAKGVFTLLAALALVLLLARLPWDERKIKVAAVLACFGGGVGFAVWEPFGLVLIDTPKTLAEIMMGRLPIDVWQSEAFAFSSALVNGLFMASLWLILVVFRAVMDARAGWGSVAKGAVAYGVLANIHSYDALLIGLVLLGLLATSVRLKFFTAAWLVRVVAILAGGLPAALWLAHVLRQDVVFQARAATLTYAAPFTPVFFGLFGLLVVALIGYGWPVEGKDRWRTATVGGAAILALVVGSRAMYASGAASPDAYFVGWGGFLVLILGAMALAATFADSEESSLWWSWAWVGLIAMYLPELFQRKLAMAMAVPWGVLAGVGLVALLNRQNESNRKLGILLGCALASLTSIFWLQRELLLLRDNVSTTTVHTVRLSPSASRVLAEVQGVGGNPVVLAMPGIPHPVENRPGMFTTPYLPDLNPFFVGLAGARTYAGHWSETPNYAERRTQLGRFIASGGEMERESVLARVPAGETIYVVLPKRETFPGVPMRPWAGAHEVVVDTAQYTLIRFRR